MAGSNWLEWICVESARKLATKSIGLRKGRPPLDHTRREKLQVVESLERRVLLASAVFSFPFQSGWHPGSDPWTVAVGDFNGDGKVDLAVANGNDNNVGVLLGNGDASFAAQRTFGTGAGPRSVAVADVNGDGRADLLVANSTYGT